MKKLHCLLALSLVLTSVSTQYSFAGSIQGSKCTKIGKTKIIGNMRFTCIKVGKKVVWNKGVVVKSKPTKEALPQTPETNEADFSISIGQDQKGWHWDARTSEWISYNYVPECEFPIVPAGALVDFSKAKFILYPGKVRGGNYKPHAAVRWSNIPEPYVRDIVVRAPFDGTVIGAWDGIDESGIYQFGLNFVSDCGMMLRMMHFYEPGPKMKLILDYINADARKQVGETYTVAKLKKGDVIALNIGQPTGTASGTGAWFDIGLLDLRQRNVNKPFGLADQTNGFGSGSVYYAEYGVCWFEGNFFSEEDKAIVNKLPVIQGTESDYCGKN
jgi:hypothetical protein